MAKKKAIETAVVETPTVETESLATKKSNVKYVQLAGYHTTKALEMIKLKYKGNVILVLPDGKEY